MLIKNKIVRWYINRNGEFELLTDEELRYQKPVESPGPGHVPSNKNYGVCIERVIWNDPATIVFWSDGTKTVVKAHGEVFDEEKGLAMAIAKKALGNEGNYYNVFKRFLITDEDIESIGEEPKSVADIIVEMCGNLEKNVQKRLEGMKDD